MKWAKRIGLTVVVFLAAGGGYVAVNWSRLQAYSAARTLRAAPADDRTRAATALLALGDAGTPHLTGALTGGDEPTATAVAAAVAAKLVLTPPADPAFAALAKQTLAPLAGYGPAGRAAVLDLVPEFLKCDDPSVLDGCREAVSLGLAAESAPTRVRAIKAATRTGVAAVVPLLADPDPQVRTAAVLTVGPPEVGVAGDEELFAVLNDADAGVRGLAASALTARGRSPAEIAFGRKLTHPSPAERLGLLVDLREADEGTVKDVGPWLERLSRDPDPAVRAGAARVAVECRLPFVEWVARLAADDPDATVRRIAGFYAAGGVRPAGGP